MATHMMVDGYLRFGVSGPDESLVRRACEVLRSSATISLDAAAAALDAAGLLDEVALGAQGMGLIDPDEYRRWRCEHEEEV